MHISRNGNISTIQLELIDNGMERYTMLIKTRVDG